MKQHPIYTKYCITEDGQVWSTYGKGKYLKPQIHTDGYIIYGICKDGKKYNCYGHRLVMQTYEPIENEYLYDAHHQDENRTNNNLWNLKWELKGEHLSEHHKGKVLSDETRRKMSKAKKGNKSAKGNTHSRGMIWYNNGETNRRYKEKPKGDEWIRGRIKK